MLSNIKYKLIILLTFSIISNAQKISRDVKLPTPKFSTETIDTVSKNFYYDYTFSFDSKNIERKKNTTTVLQIGKDKISFTDINYFKFDSLSFIHSKKEFLNNNDIKDIFPIRKAINFYKYILKSTQDKEYILQGKIYTQKYNFTEKLPVFKWQLKENRKKILDYNCKEAVVTYKGRNWTAYYTEEIPLSDGPYLFNGLPGLILEIYDDKNEHHFTAKAIDNKSSTIYLHNEKEILTVSKEEFYKTEKNFHENPGIFMNTKLYSSPNVEDNTPMKGLPYNPIELN